MSNVRRYRLVLEELRKSRGGVCEVCGEPARHPHHIIPVMQTGLADGLAYMPENMMLLCDDCHSLMHPGKRNTGWLSPRKDRGRALLRT